MSETTGPLKSSQMGQDPVSSQFISPASGIQYFKKASNILVASCSSIQSEINVED